MSIDANAVENSNSMSQNGSGSQSRYAQTLPSSLDLGRAQLPFVKPMFRQITQEEWEQDPTLRRVAPGPGSGPRARQGQGQGQAESSQAAQERARVVNGHGHGHGGRSRGSSRSGSGSGSRRRGFGRSNIIDIDDCDDLELLYRALERAEKALIVFANDGSYQKDDRLAISKAALEHRIARVEEGRGIQKGMSYLTLKNENESKVVSHDHEKSHATSPPRRLTARERLAMQESSPVDTGSTRTVPMTLMESTSLQESYEIERKKYIRRLEAERARLQANGEIPPLALKGALSAGYRQQAEGHLSFGAESRSAVSTLRVNPEKPSAQSSNRVLAYLFGKELNEDEEEPSIQGMMYDSFDEEEPDD